MLFSEIIIEVFLITIIIILIKLILNRDIIDVPRLAATSQKRSRNKLQVVIVSNPTRW